MEKLPLLTLAVITVASVGRNTVLVKPSVPTGKPRIVCCQALFNVGRSGAPPATVMVTKRVKAGWGSAVEFDRAASSGAAITPTLIHRLVTKKAAPKITPMTLKKRIKSPQTGYILKLRTVRTAWR